MILLAFAKNSQPIKIDTLARDKLDVAAAAVAAVPLRDVAGRYRSANYTSRLVQQQNDKLQSLFKVKPAVAAP